MEVAWEIFLIISTWLSEDYQFNNPGLYQFRIKQYMRMDSLPEIMSVGLRVERSINN